VHIDQTIKKCFVTEQQNKWMKRYHAHVHHDTITQCLFIKQGKLAWKFINSLILYADINKLISYSMASVTIQRELQSTAAYNISATVAYLSETRNNMSRWGLHLIAHRVVISHQMNVHPRS
jgi:hypothetical protein